MPAMRVRRLALLRRNLAALCAIGLLAGGCASSGASPPPGVARTRNLITQEEIEQANARTAYDLVQSLRPEYLRSRGVTSIRDDPRTGGLPVVYQNGTFYGPLESLGGINPGMIREIRYINARDATTRFGTNVPNGVIEIITK
jgi:hypothetical protein